MNIKIYGKRAYEINKTFKRLKIGIKELNVSVVTSAKCLNAFGDAMKKAKEMKKLN